MRNDLLSFFSPCPCHYIIAIDGRFYSNRQDLREVIPKKLNHAQPCGGEGIERRNATGSLEGHGVVVVTLPYRYTACISINYTCDCSRVVTFGREEKCVFANLKYDNCPATKGVGGSFGVVDHMRIMEKQVQEQEVAPSRLCRPRLHVLLRTKRQPCIAAAPLRTVRRSAALPRRYGSERRHLAFRNEDNG